MPELAAGGGGVVLLQTGDETKSAQSEAKYHIRA